MVGRLRRASLSTWLLTGCAAEAITDGDSTDVGDEATVGGFLSERLGESGPRCDGAPRPACNGPRTGVTCELPCLGAEEECGVDAYCHSDGTLYGLSARSALLFPGNPHDAPADVQADLERWIVGHPAELGLDAGLGRSDLELQPLEQGFRSTAGALTLLRFSQTYHGIPVLAPDGLVTVVYGPDGAVSMTGAIVDQRIAYRNRDEQAPRPEAELALRRHASAELGVPLAELEVVHAGLVAMPMARTVAWAGVVREAGGLPLARVIVDASPFIQRPILPLLALRELAVADLADARAIQARSLDVTGEPRHPGYDVATRLTTGAPLLGSVHDASGELQLATERVVVLDLHGMRHRQLAAHATRFLDPSGAFLDDTGVRLAAQVVHHLLHGWYDFIDGHLTDPRTGAKRWDSATFVHSDGTSTSDAPAATFAPRVLAGVNASSRDCSLEGIACAGAIGHSMTSMPGMAFPELVHVPAGATQEEAIGYVLLPGDGVASVTLAHEFGHIVDLFTGGGMTKTFAPDCIAPCAAECIEDTTDEAPPLGESIAQLLALTFLAQTFEAVEFGYCPIVDLVAVNGDKPWTPGQCIPPGEDVSSFQRSNTCAKPAAYCDKPEEPGFRRQCCFEDEDLTDCTVGIPDACPVGEVGPSGGMGTGTARAIPTGLCATTPGYQTNSLYQAYWQLLNGQRCDPVAPFACESVQWVPNVAPLEATTAALLYALRVNALTYDQLFDAMATYVSCNYGSAAYDDFNAVACSHGIRDCATSAPLLCERCGNGVREGSETCDGTDWLAPGCDDLPNFAGGTLTCDMATCMLDTTRCAMSGLDTTAGAETPPGDLSTSTAAPADTDTDDPGMTRADDGCACRSSVPRVGWAWSILLLSILAPRRRRSAS